MIKIINLINVDDIKKEEYFIPQPIEKKVEDICTQLHFQLDDETKTKVKKFDEMQFTKNN